MDTPERAPATSERTAAAPAADIVIVNWNAGALLRETLAALAASDAAIRFNVIVVDNASTDGSADKLDGKLLRLIRNADNRGFAAACNQAAAVGHAPFILFLNPDVRVARTTIERAQDFLANHAAAGIVGIRLLDGSGNTSRTCARRPTLAAMLLRTLFVDRIVPSLVPPHFMIEWDHLDTRRVDQVMGAFLMIRRDLFARLGGFDERFFVYYEDLDLCLRAVENGQAVVHVADVTAIHLGGGTTASIKDRRLFYETTSRVRFAGKWHGAAAAAALAVMIALFELPLRIVEAGLARPPQDARMALRGAISFWRNLPRLLRGLAASSRS
jgi:GT2 family glycosyltransferase